MNAVLELTEFPGYFATADGHIYSCYRWGHRGRDGPIYPPKRLAECIGGDGGYIHMSLRKNGRSYRRQLHTLICTAFHGPRPEEFEVRHLNGTRIDNRADNLQWGTHSQNMMDKVAHETDNRGESHPLHKLSEDDVHAIRASNLPQDVLAGKYQITQSTVSRIQTYESWGWLQKNHEALSRVRTTLIEADIREIRISTMRQVDLAKKFNMTQSAISGIRCRKTWAWVQD